MVITRHLPLATVSCLKVNGVSIRLFAPIHAGSVPSNLDRQGLFPWPFCNLQRRLLRLPIHFAEAVSSKTAAGVTALTSSTSASVAEAISIARGRTASAVAEPSRATRILLITLPSPPWIVFARTRVEE